MDSNITDFFIWASQHKLELLAFIVSIAIFIAVAIEYLPQMNEPEPKEWIKFEELTGVTW